MGIVQWLFRVRPLHLAILVLAALSFVLYVAYVSSTPQSSAASSPPSSAAQLLELGASPISRHHRFDDNSLEGHFGGYSDGIPLVTGTNQSVAKPSANLLLNHLTNNGSLNAVESSLMAIGGVVMMAAAAAAATAHNGTGRSGLEVANISLALGALGALPPPQIASSSQEPPAAANASPQQQKLAPALTEDGRPDLTKGVAAEYIYEGGHADSAGPHICPDQGAELRLLIAITSAPAHEPARMAIRQTWGHYSARRDVSIAFMLGAVTNTTLLSKLRSEELLYGDMIRGRFLDTYDNLTLKTISMLEWVDTYCSRAAYLLKTDDDMFINVPRLLDFISRHPANGNGQRAIYGRLAKKWKPIRNRKSKYYISPQQYRPAVFPDFTTGPAYLLPARLAHELYTAALNHTYFKLEDVFVTGIVASSLHVRRVHVPEFLNKRVSLTPCAVQRGITIHMVQGAEQYDLWKKLLDGVAKCK